MGHMKLGRSIPRLRRKSIFWTKRSKKSYDVLKISKNGPLAFPKSLKSSEDTHSLE